MSLGTRGLAFETAGGTACRLLRISQRASPGGRAASRGSRGAAANHRVTSTENIWAPSHSPGM